MKRSHLLAASTLDWAIGDPECLPHPVRLMGKAISAGERLLYNGGNSPARNFVAGAVLTSAVVAMSYAGTRHLLRIASRLHPACGSMAEIYLASTCLASRNLFDEASAVIEATDADDLPLARKRLARIVGRDIERLESEEISRAVIETLAESTCDGVVAPLFYLTIGGVPLAMAFKAASTLDSMIGNTSKRYLYFGRFAARLDDVANLLPARLAALAIILASSILPQASVGDSVHTWLQDGARHKSPNAGQPEAAMAGALCVRLGGSNTYGGELVPGPHLGAHFPPPSIRDAHRALRTMVSAAITATLAALLLVRRAGVPR